MSLSSLLIYCINIFVLVLFQTVYYIMIYINIPIGVVTNDYIQCLDILVIHVFAFLQRVRWEDSHLSHVCMVNMKQLVSLETACLILPKGDKIHQLSSLNLLFCDTLFAKLYLNFWPVFMHFKLKRYKVLLSFRGDRWILSPLNRTRLADFPRLQSLC